MATSGGHGNLGGNLDVITTLGGNLVGNLGQASAAGPEVTADRHGSARRISAASPPKHRSLDTGDDGHGDQELPARDMSQAPPRGGQATAS